MATKRTRGQLIMYGLGVCGVFVLCLGSLLFGFHDAILKIFMRRELILKPGYEFYDIWKEIPLPVLQNIYMFNITNPEEFAHQGAKPILQEIGPYVFRGKWTKEDMVWDDDDGTITYNDIKKYTFAPELSVGTQDEMIYTLNGPLLAVINYAELYTPSFFRSFVVEIINGLFETYNQTLLIHKSVREIVYEGYKETMVGDLKQMVDGLMTLPLKLPNDTFGILYERNLFGDGTFKIRSGLHGIEDYSTIISWNNKSVYDWWGDKKCNTIGGTDGVQHAPNVNRNKTLTIFNPNLCRTMPLSYEKDVTVHGIKTLRFSLPQEAFQTGDTNPENSCYCKGEGCYDGVLPMNCKKGAPFVLSMPHFFDGDEFLSNNVGTNPKAELHKTYVDVEPLTGFVLNAAFRMQLSGVTKRHSGYKITDNVFEGIVPVIWLSEEAQLDTHFANYYKKRVQIPLILFRVFILTCICLGAFWTVATIVFVLCMKTKVKPDKLKHSFMLKTLNSVYTSVALWPPPEDEVKENENAAEKVQL